MRVASNQDAAFIAAARTLLPAALDEIEQARRERDQLLGERYEMLTSRDALLPEGARRDLEATKAALAASEATAVHLRGIIGNLAHGGEFAAWFQSRDHDGYSFAADREYQEAVDAYAEHIASPTAHPAFDALVSERDTAIAEAREAKAALAEAQERADVQARQRAEDAAVMTRQAGAVIALRAALEEAIDLAEEAWECADSEHEPSKTAGLAEITALKAKVQP